MCKKIFKEYLLPTVFPSRIRICKYSKPRLNIRIL